MGVHSAAKDQESIAASTGVERQGRIHVSKHHAPNGGTTSKTLPSCRSNSGSRLSPRDNHQLQKSEGNDEHASTMPPRRRMTSACATADGRQKPSKIFIRTSPISTPRIRPSIHTPPPPQQLVGVAAKPRAGDQLHAWQGENSATPPAPTPSLDGEPQSPQSSRKVQSPHSKWTALRRSDLLATPKPTPPGASLLATLSKGNRPLAACQNSNLAEPSQRHHYLTMGSRRCLQTAPPPPARHHTATGPR